jgi:hypothetical protein
MNHIVFVIAGIGMAVVIGYAFWIKIRVLRLKTDILELAVDLRQSAIRLGKTDDPAFKWTFQLLKIAAGDFCGQISLPTMAYLAVVRKDKVEWPVSDDPELQKALTACKNRLGQRMSQYILLETLGGLTILLLVFGLVCVFVPTKMIQEAIAKSSDFLYQSVTYGRC